MQPTIQTSRLLLRPLRAADAARFYDLAGAWEVASMTSDVPHPLSRAQAEEWLHQTDGDVRFAIELQGLMIGSVGYFRTRAMAAELGFWLGRNYWGQGFATEAATVVLRHGFAAGRDNFSSSHFADNIASARVLAKIGFEPAGHSRIWCAARGREVDATWLFLSRARAEAVLGAVPRPAEPRSKLSARLARWLGTG